MRKTLSLMVTGALAALSLQLLSSTAFAGNPCQNIQFGADAKCEVVVEGGCTAKCEPINFTASCSAELYVECDGQCNASASLDCQATCDAQCNADCKVQPAEFDCAASCEADCGASCDAHCAASADSSRCKASCKSTCSGDCSAKCEATPPSAQCDAKCKASCGGSCEAQANVDCQVQCQSKSFAKCEADLQGGCETQCSQPDGALFCDGQYIDTRDQLKQCLDYLEGTLKIDVQGYASGDASCEGNTCTAEGEAGFSCSSAPTRSTPFNAGALAVAALGAGVFVARRRKRA